MLQASRTKRRTHFDPESRYIDTTLQNQKNELLLILSDYIAKKTTKDETIASLSVVEARCEECDAALN